MKTEIFKNYTESKKAINKLAREIWDYIDKNYKEYLEYGKYSRLGEWMFKDNHLSISYFRTYGDFVEDEWIHGISLEMIENDTWKEFIDEIFNQKSDELKREEEFEKEERRKMYEELKQEFE